MDLTHSQIWLVIGLIMLVAELISVTLVFVFFAIGALLTSLLTGVGLLTSIESQIIAFSLISLLSMLFLRKPVKQFINNRRKHPEYSEFVGETALAVGDIPEGGIGKIYYRGAEWKAVSITKALITAGSKVVIRQTDGIILLVEEA